MPKPIQSDLIQLFSLDMSTGRLFRRDNGKPADPVGALGYRRTYVNGKRYQTHQLIWIYLYSFLPDGMQVDHINGNRSDNSPTNIRLVSIGGNRRNAHIFSRNTSGTMGVDYIKRCKRWRARINYHGRSISLGYFKSKEDAITARKAAEPNYAYHHNHGITRPHYHRP